MVEKVTFKENEAVDYIKEQLSMGNWLARSLLDTIDLSNGYIKAYLPHDSTYQQRISFKHGGIITTSSSREQTARFVIEYLMHIGQACAIFEEEAEAPENLVYLKQSEHLFFTYRKEIYYFLSPVDKEQQKVDRVLRLASNYPGIGVLTSLPNTSDKLQNQIELPKVTFEEIIRNTQHILVDAYDGEAYLIWSRLIEAENDLGKTIN